MDFPALHRTMQRLLAREDPEPGLTPLAPLGLLASVRQYRLHAVSLPQSTAVFILEGTKTVHREQERLTVRAGEVFLSPARMETTVENIPDPKSGRYAALCLTFSEDMLARTADRPDRMDAPSHLLEGLHLRCDEPLALSLSHLADMAGAAPENHRLLDLCREEVLLLIADRAGGAPLLWTSASTWGARCAGVIGQSPGREWTAGELADRLGTSERSLRRHLQNEGTRLTDILREVRLGTGLSLLQGGGVSVGEAAFRCGYNSASRFAGLFRERFGISPRDVLRCGAVLEPSLADT
jgi:AraC-like DNA-binding protein